MQYDSLRDLASGIKLILTDVDGVLTDNGVYYTAEGEVMKRFSIRDGMGVERLLKLCNIETGIITGEKSPSVIRRAEKLGITELHIGIKDKAEKVKEIVERKQLKITEVAFIGDDYNDLDVMKLVGISACPSDAMVEIAASTDFFCKTKGGHGAFREFAEFIIECNIEKYKENISKEKINQILKS